MAALEGSQLDSRRWVKQAGLSGAPTSVKHIAGGVEIEVYRGPEYAESLEPNRWRLADMNGRYFEMNPMQTYQEIMYHMREEKGKDLGDKRWERSVSIATAACAEDPEVRMDVGFCIQRLVTVPFEDGRTERIVWTPLRALDRDFQRKKLGTEFVKLGTEIYSWFAPSYFMGRTQNPAVILTLKRSGMFDVIYPFDGNTFDENTKPLLEHVSKNNFRETKTDQDTGLASSLYPEGKTGGYTPDYTNPDYKDIDDQMLAFGMDRIGGDTIYYAARLKSVHEARTRRTAILSTLTSR